MVGPIYDDYVAESPDTVLLQNDDREKEKKHTLISRILGFVAMGLSLIGMLTLFAPLFEVTILKKLEFGLRNIFGIKADFVVAKAIRPLQLCVYRLYCPLFTRPA